MKKRALLGAALVIVVFGLGEWRDRPLISSPPVDTTGGGNGLTRSDEVVEGKIARKQGKIDAFEEGRSASKRPTHAPDIEAERQAARRGNDGTIPTGALLRGKEEVDAFRARQRDGGLWTWEWLGPGNIGGRTRAICTNPDNTNELFLGGASGGIWRSLNGGNVWTPINDFLPSLSVTSIVRDPQNRDRMYASSGEGFTGKRGAGIFTSVDGGLTWSQLASTDNADFTYVNRLVHHPWAPGYLFAATAVPNGVWFTDDYGASWTRILDTEYGATDIRIHPLGDAHILVGTWRGGWLSSDFGSSWTQLSGTELPADSARVEFGWSNSGSAYALVGDNGGKGSVWKSTDWGVTWTLRHNTLNILNGQGGYDEVVFVDPANSSRVIVGGIDLFRSTDNGVNFEKISDWRDYHTGSSAHADQHALVPHELYTGTTLNLVYVGNDGGIQKAGNIWTVTENSGWTNLANGLGITQFYHGAAAPDGSVIIGGTQDNDHLRYLDGGGTGGWYQAETGDGGDCAVDYTNTNIQYSEYIQLQIEKSVDGGATNFSSFNGILDAGDSDNALFIAPFEMNPQSPSELIAGGTSAWRTTNGAANWSRLRTMRADSAKISALAYFPGNTDIMWLGYHKGRISYTDSDGGFWSDVHDGVDPLPQRWVTDIVCHPTDPDVVWVTFGGYETDQVWRTTDRGVTWEDRTGSGEFDLPDVHVNSITLHPANPSWVYVGTDLGVFASEDAGGSWSTTPAGPGNEGPANVIVDDLFWYDGMWLVAATHGRGMFRSRPLDVLYVDGSHNGGEEGTASNPYDTVGEGNDAIGHGATLVIDAGTYGEAPLTLDKRIAIQGQNGAVEIQ